MGAAGRDAFLFPQYKPAANRRDSVLFLQVLAATVADLPPHSPVLSLQLLDLAHTWSDEDSSDLQTGDIIAMTASIYIHLKLHSVAALPHEDPFRDDQPPRVLQTAVLLTITSQLLARSQPHNVPALHTAQVLQQFISKEAHMLQSVGYELGCFTPQDWISAFKQRLVVWSELHLPPTISAFWIQRAIPSASAAFPLLPRTLRSLGRK